MGRVPSESEKLAALCNLVASIAHRINNPNHTVHASASMMSAVWRDIEPILAEYYRENGDVFVAGMDYEEIRELMPIYLDNLLAASKKIKAVVGELGDGAGEDQREHIGDLPQQ